jgi:hypothetical protein
LLTINTAFIACRWCFAVWSWRHAFHLTKMYALIYTFSNWRATDCVCIISYSWGCCCHSGIYKNFAHTNFVLYKVQEV